MAVSALQLGPTMDRMKSVVLRITYSCLAAHLGSVFGRHVFFWVTNPIDSILSSYLSEWSNWGAQFLNVRAAEFALEAAMMAYLNPWVILIVLASLSTWLFCLLKREWKLFYLAIFVSFASLVFVTGLSWKV